MAIGASENAAFQRALAELQAGSVKNAERSFKAVLRTQPRHIGALNLLGITLTRLGKHAEAETYLRRALAERADSDATLYNYGLVLKALNRPVEALERFSQALRINPSIAETWNNRGTVLNDLQRYEDAIADFDRATRLDPRYAEAFCNKGKSLAFLKRFPEATSAFDNALALKTDLAEAWIGRGNMLCETDRLDEALAAFARARALRPDLAEAWLSSGTVLCELQRYSEALAAFDKTTALKPDLPAAWAGRGDAYTGLKRYDEATAAYDQALALDPNFAGAWLGRGNVYFRLKRRDEALVAYDKALAARSDLAAAWLGRGNSLIEIKQYDEAFAALDRALELKPTFAEAWLGRGDLFTKIGRYSEALAAFDEALDIKPALAEAWLGRGIALSQFKRYDDALAAHDRALAAKPDYAGAWLSRGALLAELRRHEEALAAFDLALRCDPEIAYAPGLRLNAKLQLCDWTNLETETAALLSSIRQSKLASVPSALLAIASPPADQLRCAKRYMQEQLTFPPVWHGEAYPHDRIRVAYLSADLREHPVAALMAGVFEHHDRSRFEITAISLADKDDSDLGRRVRASFERFIEVHAQNDDDIADLIRRLEIDIAVDLNGFTQNGRPGVFARRAAPIQVNYLGYPGTMGTADYDYIIADSTVIPRENFEYFSEKVVWLPETLMPNDDSRHIADATPSRSELHLPEAGFVFCSFNQPHKLDPTMFDVWMRLLQQVDGSVLWLKRPDEAAAHNLCLEAERRGVAAERLVFAPYVPLAADHLARHRLADLMLDTLHYNAHTTAADALWMGLPVVTCAGATYAARVGASLLQAVGLPELVTASLDDYEALALKLARNPTLLASLKSKLVRNRDILRPFDTRRFTRHIEAAYVTMCQIYRDGHPAENFAVDAIDRRSQIPAIDC